MIVASERIDYNRAAALSIRFALREYAAKRAKASETPR